MRIDIVIETWFYESIIFMSTFKLLLRKLNELSGLNPIRLAKVDRYTHTPSGKCYPSNRSWTFAWDLTIFSALTRQLVIEQYSNVGSFR